MTKKTPNINVIKVNNDYAEIIIKSKTYGEKIVLIDIDDIEKCKKIYWHIVKFLNNRFYVVGFDKNIKKEVKLHRYLTNCPCNMQVDHINRNPLDNRKSNLRCVTHNLNQLNKKTQKNNKLGHKGITLRIKKYQVRIMINKKPISIGYFDTLKQAIAARNNFCIKNNIIA